MPIWSERASERKIGIDNDGEFWSKRFNLRVGFPVYRMDKAVEFT